MRKKELMKTAFYLVFYSFIAKILSLVVRILIARFITEEAMTLYSVAAPTMIIMITLAQMGIPATLSKILAEKGIEKKKPVSASFLLSIANNILLTTFFVLSIPLLSVTILKQNEIMSVMYAIAPLIPLITMTGLLKGYFIGRHAHNPPSFAQIVEEILRAIFILVMFGRFDISSPSTMAAITMLSVSVGEIGSLLTLLVCLPQRKAKWKQLTTHMRKVDKQALESVLAISLPITGSRLIGSFTYFLEPFIMVYRMPNADALMRAYGQLNGYILPIITMPSFLTMTLSGWLLPTFTYQYSSGNKTGAKRTFFIISLLCISIGTVFALLSFLFPDLLMEALYHKQVGLTTLRFLSLPFIVFTMQPVLSSVLHAMNQSKQSFLDTLSGSILRLASMFILLPITSENTLAISLSLGMLCTTLMHGYRVLVVLFLNNK